MALKPKQDFEIRNNWRPEVGSLVRRLLKAGFIIRSACNGEESVNVPTRTKPRLSVIIDNLTACDEARLFLSGPGGGTCAVFLVLGNSPGELAADYTDRPDLAEVCKAHYEAWDGRAQPQVYRPEPGHVHCTDGRSKWTTRAALRAGGIERSAPDYHFTVAPDVFDALPVHKWR